MANIIMKHLSKSYNYKIDVVKDFNLHIYDKEFIVLIGPSGCGKTTTLKMIAGLEEVTEGEIYIGHELINAVPSKNRDIAMVFQNYALYPHMTIYDNMAFTLKQHRMNSIEISEKVRETASILGIEDYLDRKPRSLSGGQKQRVALGRAIVRDAKVFLMDEPLSHLDAKLRGQMRAEIQALHARLETTTILVTHDQTEAMTMADRLVVMNDGVIQQTGSPKEIYDHPVNTFVAGFIGAPSMNFITLKIEEGYLRLASGVFEIPVNQLNELKSLCHDRKSVILGLRPENIYCKDDHIQSDNYIKVPVTVDFVETTGAELLLHTYIEGEKIIAKLSRAHDIHPGEEVNLLFQLSQGHFFDAGTGERITK